MKVYAQIVLVVATVFLLGICSSGCDSNNENLPWETDEYGRFHTTDLQKAQEEIPFAILIPTYIPSGLVDPPYIIGPLSEIWPENELEVQVTYQHPEGADRRTIRIFECNYPRRPPDPELNPGYHYIELSGISVVETQHTLSFGSSADPTDYPGFLFWWNKNGIYFETGVYGYDHEEAIKVIQSMIQQGE